MRKVEIVTRDGKEYEFLNARAEVGGTKLRVMRGSEQIAEYQRFTLAQFAETLEQAVQQA